MLLTQAYVDTFTHNVMLMYNANVVSRLRILYIVVSGNS